VRHLDASRMARRAGTPSLGSSARHQIRMHVSRSVPSRLDRSKVGFVERILDVPWKRRVEVVGDLHASLPTSRYPTRRADATTGKLRVELREVGREPGSPGSIEELPCQAHAWRA
jgi:hypothetical protein